LHKSRVALSDTQKAIWRHARRGPTPAVQPPRARHTMTSKKARSRARSGRLQRLVRRSGLAGSSATRMCRPHLHRITPCTTSVRSVSRAPGITLCTTGTPHNEPAYHTLHNGHVHAARLAERAFRKRDSLHHIKKEGRSRAPDAERFGIQLPQARCTGSR